MSGGKYVLPDPETVSMSGSAAKKLIGCGCGDAALLYLYIILHGGVYNCKDAASAILRTEAQATAAMAVLSRLGLVCEEKTSSPVSEPTDELPEYSIEDIRRELTEGEVFKSLACEVQKALGRALSSDDLMKLFGIYNHLGLPPEVILQLIIHCREQYEKKYGPGRIPTMRYVERAAYEWEREGIFSIEAAEEYLRRMESRKKITDAIADAIGIGNRTLVASERRYLDSWANMGFTAETAAIAYDRTVLKTGKLAWSYMDSILRSWHEKGLHATCEIEKGDSPARKSAANNNAKAIGSTLSAGGPTADDMARMQEALRRIKGGL